MMRRDNRDNRDNRENKTTSNTVEAAYDQDLSWEQYCEKLKKLGLKYDHQTDLWSRDGCDKKMSNLAIFEKFATMKAKNNRISSPIWLTKTDLKRLLSDRNKLNVRRTEKIVINTPNHVQNVSHLTSYLLSRDETNQVPNVNENGNNSANVVIEEIDSINNKDHVLVVYDPMHDVWLRKSQFVGFERLSDMEFEYLSSFCSDFWDDRRTLVFDVVPRH